MRPCESHGTAAPLQHLCNEVSRRTVYDQLLKRKAADRYKADPSYHELNVTTPRRGDRPSTYVTSTTPNSTSSFFVRRRAVLGRPWLTLLIDAFSRRLLAIVLSFDPPSYRACMLVLRECARRHHRLPPLGRRWRQRIRECVLRNTSRALRMHQEYTASCQARSAGSESACLAPPNATDLQPDGEYPDHREYPVVASSVNPRNHAVWARQAHDRLCEWAYEIYGTTEHPALGRAPRELFLPTAWRARDRCHRAVTYDDEFRMMTLPTTTTGWLGSLRAEELRFATCTIGRLFSAIRRLSKQAFRFAMILTTPELPMPLIGNSWVNCFSEHYATFRGRSEREMMLATAELRQRLPHHSRNTH